MLDGWWSKIDSLRRYEAAVLEREIADVINELFREAPAIAIDHAAITKARTGAIRRFINDQLFDKELGSELLCAKFGLSRASLYREFQNEGGVIRYIGRQRLQKALQELAAVPREWGRISQTAYKYGYDDPLKFSTVFRKEFGFTPSDALALPVAENFEMLDSSG